MNRADLTKSITHALDNFVLMEGRSQEIKTPAMTDVIMTYAFGEVSITVDDDVAYIVPAASFKTNEAIEAVVGAIMEAHFEAISSLVIQEDE